MEITFEISTYNRDEQDLKRTLCAILESQLDTETCYAESFTFVPPFNTRDSQGHYLGSVTIGMPFILGHERPIPWEEFVNAESGTIINLPQHRATEV